MEVNYFTTLWWFLSNIDMNQPRVYMCPPSQTPVPPPSPSHPSGLSQCTMALPFFGIGIFIIAKTWKQPKCLLTDDLREDMVGTHNWILLSHKKEQNNSKCRDMDETRDDHTKWSKSEKETNETAYQTQTESWTQRTGGWLPRGRMHGREMEGRLGLADISRDMQNGK